MVAVRLDLAIFSHQKTERMMYIHVLKRFVLPVLLATALIFLTTKKTPAQEELWTNLGFNDTRWITGPVTEDPSGTMYVRSSFFEGGQYVSGLYRMRHGETEWTQIESPYGIGNFFAPASGTILMQSRHDLSRSLDGGETWTLVYHDENIITTMIRLHTGEFVAPCIDHYVISSDMGDTWTSHPITATDQALEIGFDGPDRIYVADELNIYRSDDGGASWKVIYQVIAGEVMLKDLTVDSQGNLYVVYADSFTVGGSRILCSTDHGEIWTNLSGSMTRYKLASTDEIFVFNTPTCTLRS